MTKSPLSNATPRHERIYNRYERAETAVDFAGSLMFVVGSILFFYPDTTYAGTWLFLIGSLCFATRPSVRFAREYHLARLPLPGDDEFVRQ